jgi:hypothetical protein
MKIERFNEMFIDNYDYDKIITILKKKYGWGMGVINFTEDFESNTEYFFEPKSDLDYAEQFNIFLSDMEQGKMRGEFQNNHSLRLGKWKIGNQVDKPTSIYNKLL